MDDTNNELQLLDEDFIQATTDYLNASAQLAEATALCDGDPIKQDMISFITEDFLQMCARSEGIRLMAETSYPESRDFIIAEMKEVTIINLRMVEQIREKLGSL